MTEKAAPHKLDSLFIGDQKMAQSNTIISYALPNKLPATIVSDHSSAKKSNSSTLLDTVFNSITLSLVEAPWWIAMLALVFTGSLAPYLGLAAIFLIVGGLISMSVISSLSSWKGTIWIPQDIPAAILAVTSAEIVRRIAIDTAADAVFATVIVTIGLSSIITGIFLYLLGTFRLGCLVRLLPYSVLAGFLGATGCMLVLGGISNSLADASSSQLFELQALIRWLPAVLLALVMYTLSLHIKHALLIPVSMLAATLLFFVITSVSGISLDTLRADGWLFAALPKDQNPSGVSLTQFKNVEWSAIAGQSGNLILIAVFSAIAMLLNNSGFELSVKGNFDQDKDLRATGIATLLSGFVGGWPGYMSPAWSSINARQGKQLPLSGFFAALITGFLLWHATQLIEMIPRFVIGSAIAYVGISFLFNWVIEPLKKLSTMNYSLLLLTMVTFVSLGLSL
jgi:SulP family sulfate permease